MQLREFLRSGILALVFSVPFICLIVSSSMFFPFITGKNFTFRVIVELMLGMWALLMFVDTRFRPKLSWVFGSVVAFLAVLTAADFLGENPYRSFWSNYERMEGLVTHVHLFFYFLIAASVLDEWRLWKWFFRISLGVSVIVSMYAFAQLGGAIDIRQSATRLDGTFGNSTYLAIYTVMHMFIAALLYLRDGAKNSYRWVYIVVALLNFVVLYYTQTRGSVLGLIGGAFLCALLIALFDKEKKQLRKYATASVVGLIVFVLGFIAVKDAEFVRNSPTLQRFAEISLSEQTTESRFRIWNMSYQGFKENPVLGWGQDNFIYVFAKYYDPAMWKQEPWFDRSHNVFFDWLIAAGALGLLTYLLMFVSMLYCVWFSKRITWSIAERAVFTGMLAAYFVHNIFVFDNLTSYIIFFSLLAYVHSESVEARVAQAVPRPKGKSHSDINSQDLLVAGAVMLLVTGSLIYFVNVRNINANLELIQSLQSPIVDDGKGGKKIAIVDVLNKKLFGTSEAREQVGQLALQALDPRLDEKIRNEIFGIAQTQFEAELAEDPENLRVLSFTGLLYSRYGKYADAERIFQRAVEISPNRQSVRIDLGTLYASQGRYAEAKEEFKKAFELDEENPDARMYYAIGLVYTQEFSIADDVMKSLYEKKYPQAYDTRLINAYGNNKQFAKVVEIISEKISLGKETGRDYLALGGAYIELGNKEKAIMALEAAKQKDASLTEQADQFIGQLKK